MAINSTNMNKTNTHLSPQLTDHKNTTSYNVGNTGPDGIQSINCISTTLSWQLDIKRKGIYNQTIENPVHIHFHSKRLHIITNINGNINTNSTIADSMNACSKLTTG
jgi:hypothetical protein